MKWYKITKEEESHKVKMHEYERQDAEDAGWEVEEAESGPNDEH